MPWDTPIETTPEQGPRPLDFPLQPASPVPGEIDRREEPPAKEVARAWVRTESPVGAFMEQLQVPTPNWQHRGLYDPNFDLMDRLKREDPRYRTAIDDFLDVHSDLDFDIVKSRIDQRDKDRDTMARAGTVATVLGWGASMGGDPTILLPGGTIYRTGKAGVSGLKSALSVGVAAGAGQAVSEAVRRSTQVDVSFEEAATNVGYATLFGAALGAGSSMFSHGTRKALGQGAAAESQGLASINDPIPVDRMTADTLTPEESMVAGRAPRTLARMSRLFKTSPAATLATSPFHSVRTRAQELLETSLQTVGNQRGLSRGTSAEAAIAAQSDGIIVEAQNVMKDTYRAARQSGAKYSFDEFDTLVGDALARNDIGPDEFVTKAAKAQRAIVYERLLKEGQEVGVFPQVVKLKGQQSYFTRAWIGDELLRRESDAVRMFEEYVRQKRWAKTPEEVAEIAQAIVDNLVGRRRDPVPPWTVPATKSQMRGRELDIDQDFQFEGIKVQDFLERSATRNAQRYTRSVLPEVELTRRFGDATLSKMKEEIMAEARAEIAAATGEAAKDKLRKALQRDLDTIDGVRDALRGTLYIGERSGSWATTVRAAKSAALVTKLGGALLAQFGDVARLAGTFGTLAVLRGLVPQLATGLQRPVSKMAKAEARRFSTVMEMDSASRGMRTWNDGNDMLPVSSRVNETGDAAARALMRWSGISWWTDRLQHMASMLGQDRLVRVLTNTEVSKYDRGWAAQLGITSEMQGRIAAQMKAHAEKLDGIWTPNTENWTDPLAVRTFREAMSTDVRRVIIEPGAGDKPKLASHPTASALYQFTSFTFAANQRMLTAGLQGRKLRMAQEFVMGAAINMLAEYLRLHLSGRGEDAEKLAENPAQWVVAGVTRYGFFALYQEAATRMGRLGFSWGGNGIEEAVAHAFGEEPLESSRRRSQSLMDVTMGPAAGLVQDYLTIATQLSKLDVTEGGVNTIGRSIPYGTLPYTRPVIEEVLKPYLKELTDD